MASRSGDTNDKQVVGKDYPKDSIDRFGDDLCEVLLTYLSLDDRFRCECVSKQWQRVVYKTQTDLTIDDNFTVKHKLNDKCFELMVRLCENIARLEFTGNKLRLNDCMFESIVKHCVHLNAIYIVFPMDINTNELSVQTINKFFAKFAKQLKSIDIYFTSVNNTFKACFQTNLTYCTNLTRINTIDNYNIDYDIENTLRLSRLCCDESHVLFRKLRKVYIVYTKHDENYIDIFAQNYGKSLKSLKVLIHSSCDEKSVDILMTCLPQMSALVDLSLEFGTQLLYTNHYSLFKQIGTNLRQLKRLSLQISLESEPLMDKLLQTINENFKHIKRLNIFGDFPDDYVLLSDSLNACKRLTHLELESDYCEINDNFFHNIHQNMPKLQFIRLVNCVLTDITVNSLSRLPHLQTIRLYDSYKTGSEISGSAVSELITKLPKINEIYIKKSKLTLFESISLYKHFQSRKN